MRSTFSAPTKDDSNSLVSVTCRLALNSASPRQILPFLAIENPQSGLPMRLNVAVQMDPIERINIRGDSTFALLLEAQSRGHGLAYYTPDRLALRGNDVFATVRPLKVQD